jgi:hypothetical protein
LNYLYKVDWPTCEAGAIVTVMVNMHVMDKRAPWPRVASKKTSQIQVRDHSTT